MNPGRMSRPDVEAGRSLAAEEARGVGAPEQLLYRLEWHVIRRLDGLLQGDYRTLFYGYGVDLADLREYQPGDDIRYIDWNVTARMDAPYVRQYHEDRELTAWFLLDLSPSMDFGLWSRQKRNALIDFVATVARLLTRHGNRVGAILYGDRVQQRIPAGGGRLQVLRLINELLKQPRLPAAPFTDLSVLLTNALTVIKQRSLLFVVSDFISAAGWERPLKLLSRRHEVLTIRLWDPCERELPDIGLIVLQDAETGEQVTVDTSDRRFREAYQALARQREAELAELFRRADVEPLALSTQEDLVQAIVRFAALRKQRRRHR
ncbi:DUF58 domain-containing protein [Caldilinea sp.]|uniref:DUF58 domain-containing protein n=1 Tax=Caldilinea sp. TaxID=2293560 RepID=UPI0021DB80C8|nr:DUF58 domain-containing protein [Caldilinea sp.]GIV68226.1 MAG: DUF58 domain-containing protein [Caldilinea sp.]